MSVLRGIVRLALRRRLRTAVRDLRPHGPSVEFALALALRDLGELERGAELEGANHRDG